MSTSQAITPRKRSAAILGGGSMARQDTFTMHNVRGSVEQVKPSADKIFPR
jgi:hypothetical protein